MVTVFLLQQVLSFSVLVAEGSATSVSQDGRHQYQSPAELLRCCPQLRPIFVRIMSIFRGNSKFSFSSFSFSRFYRTSTVLFWRIFFAILPICFWILLCSCSVAPDGPPAGRLARNQHRSSLRSPAPLRRSRGEGFGRIAPCIRARLAPPASRGGRSTAGCGRSSRTHGSIESGGSHQFSSSVSSLCH
jgi:hypothetical protein